MNPPNPKSDLDALLTHLPEETQRAAMRVLSEWGYPLPAEDSFPVRLALITRLQLWGFARATTQMREDRQAMARLGAEQSALLAKEVELRKEFLRQMMATERVEMDRFKTALFELRQSQAGICQHQETFLQQVEAVIRRLPSPETVDKLARLRHSPDNLSAQSALRRATADMLRIARRLESMERRLESVERRPLAPPAPPVVPVPVLPPAEPVRSGRAARPVAVLIFLVVFGNSCMNHADRPFSFGMAVWYVFCALVVALGFRL